MDVSRPAPARGEVIEVVIEKVVFGGDGLARLPEGFVLFVPFAAEGERVRVRIVETKAHHARAELLEILEPSSSRVAPPCPYYGTCGGCQYQHLTYAEECRLKEAQVREAFVRQGRMPDAPILPLLPSPKDYGYRNRITVHAEKGRVGFRSVGGRELVDIEACLIARTGVNSALERLRRQRPADGHYSVRDETAPPSGFFQANHELHQALRDLVREALPEWGDLLLEGYCGGGFFTELAAPRYQRVMAVDDDPRTLIDARRLQLPNVEWRNADVVAVLPEEIRDSGQLETTVLLDPPREGLPLRLTEALGAYAVRRLIYVSCNPATLARDARLLAGSYRLVSVQPIDLFPRTVQIECVSRWERKATEV